ncbi:MAG: TrmH family RNA methyltransferase [Patescibacteria group bacterium]|nr:TrmH family RNA methyltransferase [Patescibacteria group bacterium]
MINDKNENPEIILLLDNIRSVHNVGSIFRTADTIGVNKIICVGTTPTPNDRFGRKRKDFAKVALGAEDMIAWEYLDQMKVVKRVVDMKKKGYEVVALEQAENSRDYKEVKIKGPTIIILGNEVDGVSGELLEMCDIVAEIPMRGKKESLNVAISVGIFLFRLLD